MYCFSILTTKHWVYVKEHQNNSHTPRILLRLDELLKSLDPPLQLSLVNSRLVSHKFDKLDLDLYIFRNGAIYRCRKACKRMADLKKTFKLYIIFIFQMWYKKEQDSSMHAWIAKFTASKISNPSISYNSE